MRTELDRLAENAFAREQGMAKGKAEEKIAIARAMLAEKIEPALIAKCTGLSLEELSAMEGAG